MHIQTAGKSGRQGKLSVWFLVSLPAFMMAMLLAVNARLMNLQRQIVENVNDSVALASAQSIVDDVMLAGTPANLANLEQIARIQGQTYSNFHKMSPTGLPINFADEDFVFNTIPNPLNASLNLIDSIDVTAKRTEDVSDAVPLIGGNFFGWNAVNIISKVRAKYERGVVGFRPVYLNNIPVSPIAINEQDWFTQIEAGFNPTSVATLPTIELFLDENTDGNGFTETALLNVGTNTALNATSLASIANQIENGISPAELNGAPYSGAFLAGIKAPLANSFAPKGPGNGINDLFSALVKLKDSGMPVAWPLFIAPGGGTWTSVDVDGFVAAKVIDVSIIPGKGKGMPMPKGKAKGFFDHLRITLRPAYLTDPSVVTETTQPVNPFLARVSLRLVD